jgi:hypothetical protein
MNVGNARPLCALEAALRCGYTASHFHHRVTLSSFMTDRIRSLGASSYIEVDEDIAGCW